MATKHPVSVPTTNIWDVGALWQVDVQSDEFKELLVRLYQNINLIALVLNTKDTGYYDTQEYPSQQLFPNPDNSSQTAMPAVYRDIYRKVINFGALPNTGTTSVAHYIDINNAYSFTRIYGCASDTTGLNFIPLPYASPTLANNIELRVTSTNVVITTGSNRSNFTICYVVLEYIKGT